MTYFNWVWRTRPTHGAQPLLPVGDHDNRGPIIHPFLVISSLLSLFVESGADLCKVNPLAVEAQQ